MNEINPNSILMDMMLLSFSYIGQIEFYPLPVDNINQSSKNIE